MTIARWKPAVTPTRQEQFLLKRLDRVRKLLGFLRLRRHELFDDAFQEELASMYRTTGAGKDALPPAMMALAMLVQGYLGVSDAEMVELTVWATCACRWSWGAWAPIGRRFPKAPCRRFGNG